MKLRNKKTGEVVVGINKIGLVWNKYSMPAEIGQYDSLAELNEEWEDVADINVTSISEGVIMKKVEEYHRTKSITKACEIADDLYKFYNQRKDR